MFGIINGYAAKALLMQKPNPSSRWKITDQIKKVLEVEASISKNLLCKKVLSAWGISWNGARLNNYFENLFAEMDIHKISYGNNVFF